MTPQEAVKELKLRLNVNFRLRDLLPTQAHAIEVERKPGEWEHCISLFGLQNPFQMVGVPSFVELLEIDVGGTRRTWTRYTDLSDVIERIEATHPAWHKDALEQLASILAEGESE